jgi:hypothetical protein
MNRIEILFRLSDTADNLEAAGLFREAVVLTNVMKRMAEDSEYQVALNKLIALYENGLKKNDFSNNLIKESDKVYNDYIAKLDAQIKQTNDNNIKSKLEKRKLNFYYQHQRLVQKYNSDLKVKNNESEFGSWSPQSVYGFIKQFQLEKAKDVNDFNARWTVAIDDLKKNHVNADPTLPTVFEVPGIQQYLANLYNQLKLKYINVK